MDKKIIAHIGERTFLVQTSQDEGYSVDIYSGVKSPTLSLEVLAKMGYWEEYNGSITIEELIVE